VTRSHNVYTSSVLKNPGCQISLCNPYGGSRAKADGHGEGNRRFSRVCERAEKLQFVVTAVVTASSGNKFYLEFSLKTIL
jgi:hypothetical protein